METGIIISQIFILTAVVIIGAVASKFSIITTDSKNMLSKVIFNITLPLMLFTNFLKMDATPRLITNSFIVLLVMAKELDADDHLAVGNVFVSTLLSILSLPFIVMVINRFL